MSGVKGENTVKVVGPDLRVNEAKAARDLSDIMARSRASTDLGMFRSLGQPDVRITPDRVAVRRATGSTSATSSAVVQAAIGGQAVTQVYEGEKRFDLTVRWAPRSARDLRPSATSSSPRPTAARCRSVSWRRSSRRRARRSIFREDQQPLHAGEVLGARPRPGVDDRRGAATRSPQARQAAVRHAPRVGGRDQPAHETTGRLLVDHPADAACSSRSWSTRR